MKKCKFLIGGIFLLVLVLVGTEYVGDLLYPANGIVENWKSFYVQEKDSVDLLIVGSSHAYSSFDPELIRKLTGKNTYILASNSQNVTQTYFNVKEVLKYQHPEAILLETFGINHYDNWQVGEEEEFDRNWKKESNIDGMRLGLVKLQAIMEQYIPANWFYALFKICRSHQNWKDVAQIKSNYEFLRRGVYEYDCFHPSETQMSDEVAGKYAEMRQGQKEFVVSNENILHFHKLAELCRNEGITLYMVMAPLYDGYIKKVNYESWYRILSGLAAEEGLDYLDCNMVYEDIGMKAQDFEDVFSTYMHLNRQGADKVTRYVAGRMLQ